MAAMLSPLENLSSWRTTISSVFITPRGGITILVLCLLDSPPESSGATEPCLPAETMTEWCPYFQRFPNVDLRDEGPCTEVQLENVGWRRGAWEDLLPNSLLRRVLIPRYRVRLF
jgi:hypothetical protein